jgi:hypothetical protein
MEELPLSLRTTMLGPTVSTRYGRQPYGHEAAYLQLYELEPPRQLPHRSVIPQLTLLAGQGLNTAHLGGMADMKQALEKQGCTRKNRGVFIRRGTGSPRKLVNEQHVMEHLGGLGFAIVDPGSSTPRDIAQACFDAEVVIGVEGSHLAHAFVQMSSTGAMLVIQPPDRFNNPFKDLCDAAGTSYAYVVAEARGEGFHVDLERLSRTMDLMLPGRRV